MCSTLNKLIELATGVSPAHFTVYDPFDQSKNTNTSIYRIENDEVNIPNCACHMP